MLNIIHNAETHEYVCPIYIYIATQSAFRSATLGGLNVAVPLGNFLCPCYMSKEYTFYVLHTYQYVVLYWPLFSGLNISGIFIILY